MRHRVRSTTLGRLTGHRLSMLRNLATSLLEHKKIETTETRAKEVSRYVERLIETAKNANKAKGDPNRSDVAYKRAIFAKVYSRRDPDDARKAARDRTVARQLFDQIATRYLEEPGREERKGGYTRITRLANRKGDGALVVLLELV
jgi:large subunit ribosomal protein L17